MSEYCVVVAEVARARIFTLEPAKVPDFDSGPNLIERTTLTNPERRLDDAELYTNTSGKYGERARTGRDPGRNNATTVVTNQSFDDNREDNARETNKRFVRDLVEEIEQTVQSNQVRHLVLCAEPQLLGYLRPELSGYLPNVDVEEVQKDLTGFSAQDVHNHLASDGHLPPRKMGAGAPPTSGGSRG